MSTAIAMRPQAEQVSLTKRISSAIIDGAFQGSLLTRSSSTT